ncbi:hypothetical protein T4B_14813 [Trichinella pseudospiralis]|uniref:Uncharacterized protein n=2 Tax=Trichinella pseudospiralis TaxID=6337 RepID=A0A0V1FQ60_TRIPS|nr:hypothetical protein T4A_13907 [Trichinella pseudospiralis]KRY88135.1 hypothetical protein T4D_5573 [Trichinella pseudospiralis]KRZ28047.1 hypothetical protein T4B_14813 [Trichinella pseudospiralis]
MSSTIHIPRKQTEPILQNKTMKNIHSMIKQQAVEMERFPPDLLSFTQIYIHISIHVLFKLCGGQLNSTSMRMLVVFIVSSIHNVMLNSFRDIFLRSLYRFHGKIEIDSVEQ